jgi:hAT family C-terminal dimerisation region
MNNLPFCLVSSVYARVIFAVDSAMTNEFHEAKLKHRIIELYVYSKRVFCAEMVRAKEFYGGPFLTLLLDAWKSKSSNEKYLGIRVCYVFNRKWKSQLLSVRKYDPSLLARTSYSPSILYRRWVKTVLEEFSLEGQTALSISDGANDMRAVLRTNLELPWSWCFSHCLSKAVSSAFAENSAATDAKNLLERIKTTVTKVKSIEVLGSLFEDLKQQQGTKKGLLKYSEHRFIGVYRVVDRIVHLWEPLVTWFDELLRVKPSEVFPLHNQLAEIKDFHRILKPLYCISTEAQSSKPGAGAQIMKHVCELVVGGRSDQAKERKIWDLNLESYLTTVGCDLLDTLKMGLLDRVFEPMTTDEPNCLIYLCQLKLVPFYRKLDPIREIFIKFRYSSDAFEKLQCNVLKCIKNVGRVVAAAQLVNEQQQHWVNQIQRTGMEIDGIADQFSDFGVSGDYSGSCARISADQLIEAEMEKYMSLPRNSGPKSFYGVVDYWSSENVQTAFPVLSRIALIFNSAPASTGILERDFGSSGNLITRQRTSLGEEFVEMCMFVKANDDKVNLDQVISLSASEIPGLKPQKVFVPPLIDSDEDSDDEVEASRKRGRK